MCNATKRKGLLVVTLRPINLLRLGPQSKIQLHCKLDLADTDLAENLGLKDALQKIWANIFYFQDKSLLKIAENLGLADKRVVTDFSAKSSFHCTYITTAYEGITFYYLHRSIVWILLANYKSTLHFLRL